MSSSDRRHDVLNAIGRAIVAGEIAPDESLTLEGVQSRYGISRTLARDCVRALESLGMVEPRRRVGIVVRPRESWSALAPQVVRWQLDVELPAHDLGGQCRPALTGPHHDAHTTARLDHAEGFQSAHAVAGEGARDAVAGLNALQGQ